MVVRETPAKATKFAEYLLFKSLYIRLMSSKPLYFHLIDYCWQCEVLCASRLYGENVLIRYVLVFVFLPLTPSLAIYI